MVSLCSTIIPLYTVNEYPKSGGTWLGQMLSRALNIPFPRNRFPILKPSIMHGHFLNSDGMRNVVILWRDGRDVMVSWYHHCLFVHEIDNDRLVKHVRKSLQFNDYEDVKGNLAKFIEYSFTKQRHPPFSWADFVNNWHDNQFAVFVKYEDLRINTPLNLQQLVTHLSGSSIDLEQCQTIADEFSFVKLAKRKPGEENRHSFLRKGLVGDWKNYFNSESCEVFNNYAGKELIKLGYENDDKWF